jgi:hypothetical protein
MTLKASEFMKICDKFPAFRSHLTSRGIKRRSHLRLVEIKLRRNLNLSEEHNRWKDEIIGDDENDFQSP